MKRFIYFIIAGLVLLAGCQREEPGEGSVTVISAGAQKTKTSLGAEDSEHHRAVYWNNGDCLALNGTASDALEGLSPNTVQQARFTFHGSFSAPYQLLYPASLYKNATTITLPAQQTWASGGVVALPLAASLASASDNAALGHLCAYVQIRVKKSAAVSAANLVSVSFKGNAGEQVCGDFTIDYANATLTPAGAGAQVTVSLNEALSESADLDVYLVVAARNYSAGFTVELEDAQHRSMKMEVSRSITLQAGQLARGASFTFEPYQVKEMDLELTEEIIAPDGYNVTGRVVDSDGNGLEGVVVSDGLQSVRTLVDGHFFMTSNLTKTKYVYVSTPSGYLPPVSGGRPQFYKKKADITPSAGVYDFGNYILTPVANPDRFTLLISADPQPRKSNWTLDKVAYRSLDVCQDLYQELYDVASAISDRQVYGICLGDVVHEDMSLYANYVSALNTLGYPTYNILGNHDNDPAGADDDEGAEPFESYFGPRNYSFNIGGIHFVVLDNLIMKMNTDNELKAYDQGLTDDIWAWLQSDMAYVSTDTKVMVCAHSPMFKQQSGSERTNTAYHGGSTSDKDGPAFGYGDLFDQYNEVHAWAGHTHSGFNFIYGSTHRHKNIQVHTLARSTGELWTNEYLANGTPRGFTIVEVDNGTITWKFHPVTRQRGAFQGVSTGYCSAGAPAYTWRDWTYNGSGVAVMNGGGALTEEYQMHAYPRGAYGDDYVYVNVFLWDEAWQKPVWTPTGGTPVEMTRIYSAGTPHIADTEKIYDKADTEFRTWYKAYANKSGGSLAALDGYHTVAPEEDGLITTLFRAPADATPSSGTVSVTDRFGNVYSCSVSW